MIICVTGVLCNSLLHCGAIFNTPLFDMCTIHWLQHICVHVLTKYLSVINHLFMYCFLCVRQVMIKFKEL